MKISYKILFALLISLTAFSMRGLRLEPIPYGDFSNWKTRGVTESKLIGGKHKTIYEIAPEGHTEGNIPYSNEGGSPWATSNVYAKVVGVVK